MIALLASSPKNTVTLTRQRVVEVADPYNSPSFYHCGATIESLIIKIS